MDPVATMLTKVTQTIENKKARSCAPPESYSLQARLTAGAWSVGECGVTDKEVGQPCNAKLSILPDQTQFADTGAG